MQGVLYVSHGSRVPEATQEAIEFITDVQQQVDISLQTICFLELAEPTIAEGVETLVKQGATTIAVIPVLLLSAGHYFKDIPQAITTIQQQYPHVSFTYGQPLGVQSRLTQILQTRINETAIPINEDAQILVVGRGSYNPQTQVDITAIAQELQTLLPVNNIEVCYLAACQPSFEDALTEALVSEYSQIFIVPYIWFTGILERHIAQTVETTKSSSDIVLCDHLGHHPAIKEALKDRVLEAVTQV
ncbi:sirohydrochlorin chelatase [Staphylococcus arlettae]|uniref:sirohydrochlorin chelatase n=1 Tax=Staphylococcus arlettae TaxID=29378 RepID=UPI001E423361|nr:sirohydrochlorin chelatase [Staphylococcus arlettae]MCD8834470.1 sirohydrochlorin chelatase [Staphylococcus arlettae]MCD8888917.1 sirohydrochlorin chelatase [Staphylococcus arlettae]